MHYVVDNVLFYLNASIFILHNLLYVALSQKDIDLNILYMHQIQRGTHTLAYVKIHDNIKYCRIK